MVRILEGLLKDGVFVSEGQAIKEFPNFPHPAPQEGCWAKRRNAPDTVAGAEVQRNSLLEKPTGCEEVNDN